MHGATITDKMASYLQALHRNDSLQFFVILRKKEKVLNSQKTQCLHYEDQLLRLRREIIAVRCQKLRKHTKTPSTGCESLSVGDTTLAVRCKRQMQI